MGLIAAGREPLLRLSVDCARSLRARPAKPPDPSDLCLAAAGLLAAEETRALRRALDEPQPIRPGSVFVWAACRYALQTDNMAWAGMNMERLESALGGSDADAPFMSRVLRWRALDSLAELCRAMGRARAAADWRARANAVIRESYRAKWDARAGHFDAPLRPEGNLAAAAWGFADEDASARILRTLDRLGWCTPWGPRSSRRTLLGGARPADRVELWVCSLELQALLRLRWRTQLRKRVELLGALVDAAGHVPASCGADGRNASPAPSIRAAGMLLEACGVLLAGLLGSLDKTPFHT